ncbi:unnamed protein product [Caenorhabditis bovis]|uniref:Mitochondrial inner membrane protein Mpv17 n=1 Tax=Caenorhabditis bovis TaxID=2654633 RepID=A0A8S1EJV2_9PELO|nr:unnamed protein product [Caenorhabditis bovis]
MEKQKRGGGTHERERLRLEIKKQSSMCDAKSNLGHATMAALTTMAVSVVRARAHLSHSFMRPCISGSGDRLTQLLTKKDDWDRFRTLRFAFLSGCFMAPTIFRWYKLLKRLNHQEAFVLKKVVLDQCLFSPMINACMLFNLKALETFSITKAKDNVKKHWPQIYGDSLKVSLPIVAFVNFCFVPVNYRVLVNQLFAFFWNAYISFRTQRPDLIEQVY